MRGARNRRKDNATMHAPLLRYCFSGSVLYEYMLSGCADSAMSRRYIKDHRLYTKGDLCINDTQQLDS